MERIFCKIKRVKRKLDGKRITAKVMSAVLIASSMLNAFAPVAAYAAEPELATVSLSETQHGKLSFDGTEDMTLAVEVGTDHSVPRVAEQGVHVETGYELPVILGIVELDHRVGAGGISLLASAREAVRTGFTGIDEMHAPFSGGELARKGEIGILFHRFHPF